MQYRGRELRRAHGTGYKAVCLKLGLKTAPKLKDIAKRSGYVYSHVCTLFQGHRGASLDAFEQISKALGVPVARLISALEAVHGASKQPKQLAGPPVAPAPSQTTRQPSTSASKSSPARTQARKTG